MININLLPKQKPFDRWFSAIGLTMLLFGALATLYSSVLYHTSDSKQIELQNKLALLENKERIYTEMSREKQYVFIWQQLKDEAVILKEESVNWIPLIQTLYGYLPNQGSITSVSYSQGSLSLEIVMGSRTEVAGYEQFLRSSSLFEDVFVTNIAGETGTMRARIEAKLVSSFYKGGETQ
jgi:Tfp pilus assembly protein PilN